MAVWRLVTHHEDPERLLKWSRDANRIGLGWSAIGSLSNFKTESDVTQAVGAAYATNANRGTAGVQLWRFCHEMKEGDMVILSASGQRACVMEVAGPYFFDDNWKALNVYGNQRNTKPTYRDADELWQQSGGMAVGQTIYRALIQCKRDPRETP